MKITIHIEDDKRPEITVADAREFPPIKGFLDADEQPKEETCKWTLKTHKDYQEYVNPHNGKPWITEKQMKHCPYCGKKIEVVE